MASTWITIAALALCALAASAAPSGDGTAMQFVHTHEVENGLSLMQSVTAFLERTADDLEDEVNVVVKEAYAPAAFGVRGIVSCATEEFNTIVELSARALGIAHEIRTIIKELMVDINDCEGNIFTAGWCQINLLKLALQQMSQLKTEGGLLIQELKDAVKDFNECLKNPPTAAPTAAPTEAPATEAPATEAPATEAPSTEAPATEAPATEAPATSA